MNVHREEIKRNIHPANCPFVYCLVYYTRPTKQIISNLHKMCRCLFYLYIELICTFGLTVNCSKQTVSVLITTEKRLVWPLQFLLSESHNNKPWRRCHHSDITLESRNLFSFSGACATDDCMSPHIDVVGGNELGLACVYTGCPRRNVPDFGRVFLMVKYTDITQNTCVQIWTVTEIMAREVWNFDSCYTLIDYQIHIKTGRNMWFL